ncbi:MAG: T9SS type A sorting domain-containing protein [Saprospiraceae bacterium]
MAKKMTAFLLTILVFGIANFNKLVAQSPPFGGTIFLDPDIITPEDPTTFLKLEDAGRGIRTMFDRRVNDWINVNAYLFNATFDDGLSTEIQVNPEFGGTEAALSEAEKYAPFIGQLPTVLRKDAETVWIHKGVNPFGGGNRNILIHTGQAALYVEDGILEETLIHEASHTSLDDPHASTAGWKAAQAADPTFISTYAQEFSTREDVAETFLLYLALRYKVDRIDEGLKNTIMATIPNRIAYFDELMLDMHPLVALSTNTQEAVSPNPKLTSQPNPFHQQTTIAYDLPKADLVSLTLYNLQGQKIEPLLPPSRQVAGQHELTINAKQLTQGIYFVHLQAGETNVLHKIMVF